MPGTLKPKASKKNGTVVQQKTGPWGFSREVGGSLPQVKPIFYQNRKYVLSLNSFHFMMIFEYIAHYII